MPKGIPTSGRRKFRNRIEATTRFGLLIREMRLDRDWTQEALASRAGTSDSYITKLETGTSIAPPLETLAALARAFDLDHQQTIHLAFIAASERLWA